MLVNHIQVAYVLQITPLEAKFMLAPHKMCIRDSTSMELTADIYIDRTSIEVFIDGGAYSYSMKRSPRAVSYTHLNVYKRQQ